MPARARLRRSGKPLHPTHWCSQAFFNSAQTSEGTVGIDICTSTELEAFTAPTIVRVRGQLWAGLTRNSASTSESVEYAIGLLSVPEGLDTDDVASLLTQDGAQSQWMWFHNGRLQSQLISFAIWNGSAAVNATGSYSGPAAFERIPVDVKAMRRIPSGNGLRLYFSWETNEGSPDFAISGQLRALVKE